ncbi:MAG: DUF4062 domain-containing protein, partial [Longimicrobiales bacterium]|nr:DUF4062 domain-containing protein [Longimicrobiales bacterium]
IVELGFDGDTDPDPSDKDTLPASMATEEMVENLCSKLGIGEGGSAGVLRWLDVLLAHHVVVVDGEGGNERLRRLKEWADFRAASGVPSPALSSQEVRAAAAQNAQEAGQPLVTPQNVAIAIVKLAAAAFTSARDEYSTAAEPPEPSPERSSPLKEAEPPEAGPGVAPRATELELVSEVPDAPAEVVSPEPRRTRTFRLFVSSTFADLQAERNALQEIAFPRLRDFCARHGARFQAIDLRWGVSEEAGVDQQTMNICLGEIERCHQVTPKPNFLVLLGDRYGWSPPPAQIPADEFEEILKRVVAPEERARLEHWYRKDLNADPPEFRLQPRSGDREAYRPWEAWEPEERGIRETLGKVVGKGGLDLPPHRLNLYRASATEQEVLAGALELEGPVDKVFCFFREIKNPPEGEGANLPEEARDFISSDPRERDQLRSLKRRLYQHLPESSILKREVDWGDRGPELTQAFLFELAEWVAESLEQAILRELEHPAADLHPEINLPEALRPDPTLTAEVAEHLLFAEERRRFFVGREDILEEIAEYTRGDDRNPLAIVGEGGAGKSALMAEAARRIGNASSNGTLVIRFVGATPGSSDGRILLDGLCREIALQYGHDPGELPNEYNELVPKLAEQLELATRDQPLVLMVDSLDQLARPAMGLTWIPSPLPPHVRLVVSSRPDEVGARLKSRGAAFLELGPLRRADGECLLKAWLASAKPPRRLQPLQQEAVLDAFFEAEGNPLYLKLAAEE